MRSRRRWFDWNGGWMFEVEGKVVARGWAIGLLEAEMQKWVAETTSNTTS